MDQTHAKPIVAAQALTKVFKDFWMRSRVRAVDNLTFEIHPHEVFGLLGPNGSGKSTTIKLILGLLKKTSGRLLVFNRAPTVVSIKKQIGYLPEESYLYPFLNARETLDYYGKLFQLDHRVRHRRIDELLDMVGLTAVQYRPVREYSKGMQRRIGIAQALINDPTFLILDEPTTGLDPIGTRQMKDLIIELGRRGKTVLLSSHLLADVEDCVDRMVILYGGRQRQEGTCESLLVAQSRTTIETDVLTDDEISEIDRVLRERSGGNKSVLSVSKPRQKLEELFLDIVERARAERLETSGVVHGGQTAAFLRESAAAEGQSLIDRLTRAPEEALPPPEFEPTRAPVPSGPDEDVIGGLLAGRQDQPSPKTSQPAAPPERTVSTEHADRALIDSLIDDSDDEEQKPGRTP